jgi:antitoxin component of RelBE/YafQ-DinJ toxin-antitoxin module
MAKEIGTTPGEVVRLLFAQMARRRTVPFPLEVETPEDEVLSSPKRRARMMDEMYEGKPEAR